MHVPFVFEFFFVRNITSGTKCVKAAVCVILTATFSLYQSHSSFFVCKSSLRVTLRFVEEPSSGRAWHKTLQHCGRHVVPTLVSHDRLLTFAGLMLILGPLVWSARPGMHMPFVFEIPIVRKMASGT